MGSILESAPIRPIVIPQSTLQSADLALTGEDEAAVVERLIAMTQKQLEVEKKLQELISRFKLQREAFSLGDHSKKRAAQMVKVAREILEAIQELHVQHLFPSDFLEELKVFSSIAGKNQIKKP